jgi:hypothetical protein
MMEAVHPAVVLLDEGVHIPGAVHALEEFRRWSHGEQFPERGRIDYLQGDIEVDMGPQDLDTHGTVKVAIAARLHTLVAEQGRGAPDLVVEVVSTSSVAKDRQRLPALYAKAGVPELWLVDARDEPPAFEIWSLHAGAYEQVAPEDSPPDGWTASPVLGCRFRLQRRVFREGRFVYDLESTS